MNYNVELNWFIFSFKYAIVCIQLSQTQQVGKLIMAAKNKKFG
jgi:hypothetical protein